MICYRATHRKIDPKWGSNCATVETSRNNYFSRNLASSKKVFRVFSLLLVTHGLLDVRSSHNTQLGVNAGSIESVRTTGPWSASTRSCYATSTRVNSSVREQHSSHGILIGFVGPRREQKNNVPSRSSWAILRWGSLMCPEIYCSHSINPNFHPEQGIKTKNVP